jgi:Ca2+ transporting ATPase
VLTVGDNTYIRQQTKLDASDESPLQEKLSIIAEQIGVFGMVSAFLTVLVITTKVIIYAILDNQWDDVVGKILKALIIGVSVVVCAIPEGLPLAVTISLAYSVRKMMDDNNLVKKINSCETMGNADCICTDKTGTLTENLMTIMEIWTDGNTHPSAQASQHSSF